MCWGAPTATINEKEEREKEEEKKENTEMESHYCESERRKNTSARVIHLWSGLPLML